jgi:hypothetical protein
VTGRDDRPSRIVCLTEETTETLHLLGEEARIVGISGYTVRPARARREKPKVSAFTSGRIERIVEDPSEAVRRAPDIVVSSWCRKKFRPEHVRARPGAARRQVIAACTRLQTRSSRTECQGSGTRLLVT